MILLVILELLFIRDGYFTFDNFGFFTTSDAITLIDSVSTS